MHNQYNILPRVVVLKKFKRVPFMDLNCTNGASQVMSTFLYPLYYYCRSGNFTLKIIRAKNFHGVKFSQFVDPQKPFNGSQLQYIYGRVPGAFLVFSQLPGMGYRWLLSSIRHLPWGVWSCVHTYPLIVAM